MTTPPGPPPPLPREHGAWVMLVLPQILGFGLAGGRPSAAWLVPPAAVMVFLAHYALVPVAQRRRKHGSAPRQWWTRRLFWGTAYLFGSCCLFTAAVALTPATRRPALLAVSAVAASGALVYGVAAVLDAGRRLGSELVGMAGMSLLAPMMALAAGGTLDGRAFAAAVLAFAYFVSSLTFVRTYGGRERASVSAIATCTVVHLLLLVGLGWIGRLGWLSPWWLAAFLPIALRTVWGLISPPVDLRRLGLREIWVALSFTILAVLTVTF